MQYLRWSLFSSEREFDGYWQLSATRMATSPALSPSAKKHSDWLEGNLGKANSFPVSSRPYTQYTRHFAGNPADAASSIRRPPHGVWKTWRAEVQYLHFHWTRALYDDINQLPHIDCRALTSKGGYINLGLSLVSTDLRGSNHSGY